MDTEKEITTIDDYISQFETPVQKVLKTLRETIRKYAPDAVEKISWAMPTFYMKENLIHFAAHKNHIGLYPGAEGIEYFADTFDQLGYKYSKGAVQFPMNKPLPLDLIQKIVEYRVNSVKKK